MESTAHPWECYRKAISGPTLTPSHPIPHTPPHTLPASPAVIILHSSHTYNREAEGIKQAALFFAIISHLKASNSLMQIQCSTLGVFTHLPEC
jgi:hypothetical protein